jgi:YNFM family putative membrane transporter
LAEIRIPWGINRISSGSLKPAQLGVVLAGFCAFVGFYATQPLLPLLAQVFHASKVAVSLTITASTIGVAIAAPIVGRLADFVGRRRIIITSALLAAICNFLAATSPGLRQFVMWRFIQGLITPGVFAITVAYINDEWPARQTGRGMGAYVTGTVVGGFSGRMIAGLTAGHMSWRWVLVVLGIVNLVAALAVWAWLPPERKFVRAARSSSFVHAVLDHLTNRRLLATYAVGFCVFFSMVAMFTYVTFHLADPPFLLSSAALGFVFCVFLVGMVITPICTRYIERFGHRIALTAAVAMGISGVLLTLVSNLWVVLIGLCICSSGVFISQATASSHIGTAAKDSRALAVGLYATFYYLGGSAGGSIPGWLWSIGGWPACVALVALVQVATVVIAWVWWPVKAPEAITAFAAQG